MRNKKNVQKQFSNIFLFIESNEKRIYKKKSFDNLNHLYIIQRRM